MALPFPVGSFDLTIAMTLLHEIPPSDRSQVVAEMRRVTADDGRLLVIDHHPGRPRGARHRLARAFATGIERIAGGEHYRNYREFRAGGGIPGLAEHLGLTVERSRVEGSGTIGVYLLR
jgi:ubiquinone/menaquinone biosynthesis C-methylase UbiE